MLTQFVHSGNMSSCVVTLKNIAMPLLKSDPKRPRKTNPAVMRFELEEAPDSQPLWAWKTLFDII